jgi:hypothetical protein
VNVRPLFLSLGNFLGASGVVLLLFGRLHLFLHRVLVRGFRRFVTHDPERKIHGNRRQPEAGAFPIATIVTQISARKSERSFADDAHQNDNYALAARRRSRVPGRSQNPPLQIFLLGGTGSVP